MTSAPPRDPRGTSAAAGGTADSGRIRELYRRLRGQIREQIPHPRSRSLLGSMPVFARCSRRQLFRIARWGDVIEVPAGTVLIRELHIDYWFIVVLDGSVRLTRSGRTIGTLRHGDHFGEVSIVGFRPQTATAVAAEQSLLFVIGRRYLLSLAATDTSIQRALFPALSPGGYQAFARELQASGRLDWEKLDARRPLQVSLSSTQARPAGRRLTWAEAIERLSQQRIAQSPVPVEPADRRINERYRTRVRVAVLVTLLGALVATGALYHPPVAVIRPGTVIDVSEDITISGARRYPVHGRYLLTPVRVERPNLARTVFDLVLRHEVVRTNAGEIEGDPHAVEDKAHDAMLLSHRDAIALAERAFAMDAEHVRIAVRDRGILGPSGGLVYALAIADMLGADDLAAGRTVAATGELRDDGGIASVGFIELKARAAVNGAAGVFLVPVGQVRDIRVSGMTTRGVRTLDEAIRYLRTSDR